MKNSFKSTARLALATTLCALGLTTQAQTITAGATNSAPCVITPTTTNATYTFAAPAGYQIKSWTTQGDIALTTPAPTGIGTNNSTATMKSVVVGTSSGPGYGKGRVIANYRKIVMRSLTCMGNTCTYPDTTDLSVSYDVIKKFNAPNPIVGPICVVPGQSYAYAVPAILTSSKQLRAGIGYDGYTWSGMPTGTGAAYSFSGDSSSVIITMPTNLSTGFTLKVVVGRCNAASPAFRTLAVGVAQAPGNIITAASSCRATDASSAATFTVNTVSGTNYAITLPLGWGFAAPVPAGLTLGQNSGTLTGTGSAIAVPFTTDGNANDILVQTTGGCSGGQSAIKRVTRALSSLNVIQNPGCLTRNTPTVITLAPAPANSFFYWTVPTGWPVTLGFNGATLISGSVYRTNAPSIQVTPKGNGGVISVNSGDITAACPSGTVLPLTLAVSGGRGCGPFTLYRTGTLGRGFGLSIAGNPAPNTCLPDGAGTQIYTWSTLVASATQTRSSDLWEMGTTFSASIPAGQNVSVRIQSPNAADCYDTTVVLAAPMLRPAGGGGGTVNPVLQSRLARTMPQELNSYPNPAGAEMTVELSATEKNPAELTITDGLGRVVMHRTLTQARGVLDVRSLPTGVYMLRATYPDGQVLGQQVQISH